MPSLMISCVSVPEIERPLKRISPASIFRYPKMVSSKVDLPAPFGPITLTISFSLTSHDTPCRTFCLPYPETTPFTSSNTLSCTGRPPAGARGTLFLLNGDAIPFESTRSWGPGSQFLPAERMDKFRCGNLLGVNDPQC